MLTKYFPLCISTFLIAFVFTVVIEKMLIPFLKKRAKQPIYEEGPAWHISKSGTPTMGGLAFLISSCAAMLFSSLVLFLLDETELAASVILVALYSVANAFIGIADDLEKLKKEQNAGLTPLQKLALQSIFAALFLFLHAYLFGINTRISFSLGTLNLGVFFYPLAFILLLGTVNCANLTDGIDGLATSVALTIGSVLFCISARHFLDITLICAIIMGAAAGFLIFNINPAKVFMGDTGSLFFGAIIVASSFILDNPFAIIGIGIVYVLEGVSVIAQVLYFKTTGKRLFKMAPLHHHLEKCGMSENKICAIAIATTIVSSILTYLICFYR